MGLNRTRKLLAVMLKWLIIHVHVAISLLFNDFECLFSLSDLPGLYRGVPLDFTSLKRFSHTENHKCHSRRRSGAPLDPARQHLRRIWARIFIPPGPCQPMSRTRPSAESSSSLEVNSRTVFSVHARILVQDANKQVDAGARAGSARGARAASARRVIRVRTCPCSNA